MPLTSEADVKACILAWFKRRRAWSFAPVSNGMGVHGVPDRIGCVPIEITPDMVGKTIGVFVGVEAKKPGRRGELNRGASARQVLQLAAINDAGGIGIICDGPDDLAELEAKLK